jgi:hypothetical protein
MALRLLKAGSKNWVFPSSAVCLWTQAANPKTSMMRSEVRRMVEVDGFAESEELQ